ncbi:MAG: ThuA domain-containing protein [Sedimentisphaerales bacterium]|nr:ThuA domain-containing protein [Sedimentisphaerales bacterium]
MADKVKVTVWNEFLHERTNAAAKKLYPDGMHAVIAESLRAAGDIEVRTATLDEPEHGLTKQVVNDTDVLIWWGDMACHEVSAAIVKRLEKMVLAGMGLIVLHSGRLSRIFRKLMGTSCLLRWCGVPDKERLWNLEPGHPITEGIGEYIDLPDTEMYSERFDIPAPEKLIFVSRFKGGDVFRSGCVWERGHGRIFYFRPGHETCPVFYNEDVQKVLVNAVRWAKPRIVKDGTCSNTQVLKKLESKKVGCGF